MTIKINFKNSSPKNPTKNLILFVDDKFNTQPIKKFLSNTEFLYISDLLKTNDLKKNINGSTLLIILGKFNNV